MPDIGPDIGPDTGPDISGAAFFAPDPVDPGIPTGPTQTLTYPLHLPAPAVVTLAGLGYVQQGLVKLGPFAVAIGLRITEDGVLTPVDGLPHSDYVLTMLGIPDPVPGLVAGFAVGVWKLLVGGEAETVSAVVVVRGAMPVASRYFTRVGSPLTDDEANILYSGEFVYLPVTLLDPDKGDAAVDLMDPATVTALEMALARGGVPAESDWVAAAAYAGGGGQDGPVVGAALTGLRAPYGVYVRLTVGGQTVTRRAPGLLIVR